MKRSKNMLPSTASNYNTRKFDRKGILLHETANQSNGADAEMHGRYLKGQDARNRSVSWHGTVDDSQYVQHLPYTASHFSAGDGGGGRGNTTLLSLEMCVNKDGDFDKTIKNAITIMCEWCEDFKLSHNTIELHQNITGKNCPATLLSRHGKNTLSWIRGEVKKELDRRSGKGTKDPSPTPPKQGQSSGGGQKSTPQPKRGEGVQAYMTRIGLDGSYANRAKIASQLGIKNYSGTASQNNDLQQRIARGDHQTQRQNTTRPQPRAGEGVQAYMNRIGLDGSYANRERLARQAGINGYRGTASQNNQLQQWVARGNA